MFPNLLVNRFLWENEPGFNSVHIVGVCSSVALELNSVQDTLAALLVHSQSCKTKSTVVHGNEFGLNLFLIVGFL